MNPEVHDAIDNARTVEFPGADGLICRRAEPTRKHSFEKVRAIVLAVAQELPSEMTMQELCDELAIANNQVQP